MQPYSSVFKMKKCCIMVRARDWACQNSWETTTWIGNVLFIFSCIFKTGIKLTHLIRDLWSVINVALWSLEIKILMEWQSPLNNINAITDVFIKGFF